MKRGKSIAQVRRKNRKIESGLQRACVGWFRLQYVKYKKLLFSIPNGAMLQGTELQRQIQGKQLKLEGLVAGVADLFLCLPGVDGSYGLFIEMKTEDGRQTDSQKEFEAAVKAVGYRYELCRSFDQFRNIIKSHIHGAE